MQNFDHNLEQKSFIRFIMVQLVISITAEKQLAYSIVETR